jgi:hypothetical protein
MIVRLFDGRLSASVLTIQRYVVHLDESASLRSKVDHYRLLRMLIEEWIDECGMTQPRLRQLGDIAITTTGRTGERNRPFVPVGIAVLLALVSLVSRVAASGPSESRGIGFHRRGLLRWSRKGEEPVYGTDSKTSSLFNETGRATIESERIHYLRGGSLGGGNLCLLWS